MNTKTQVQRNARTIAELYGRVRKTVRERDTSPAHRQAWRDACAEFHARYDTLAFPGGISTARDRMRSGDTAAIEYALCFIEVRPYFFRSGYMYNDLLRILRNCDLTQRQQERYYRVYEAYLEYRRERRRNQDCG